MCSIMQVTDQERECSMQQGLCAVEREHACRLLSRPILSAKRVYQPLWGAVGEGQGRFPDLWNRQ